MKFSKVVGKIPQNIVTQCEDRLTRLFIELAVKYDNYAATKSKLGGDPFIFTLSYPVEHVLTRNLPTAATDGKRYYWNPAFIMCLTDIGLRLVNAHEAFHDNFMHPQRRGARNPKLWNWAVDYIVWHYVLADLKDRLSANGKDKNIDTVTNEYFTTNFGKLKSIPDLVKDLKDPLKNLTVEDLLKSIKRARTKKLDPNKAQEDEKEFSVEDEIKEIKKSMADFTYFGDGSLPDNLKTPEKIYDFLKENIRHCPKCGRMGAYPMPKKIKNELEKALAKESESGSESDKTEKSDKESTDSSSSSKTKNKKQSTKGTNGGTKTPDNHSCEDGSGNSKEKSGKENGSNQQESSGSEGSESASGSKPSKKGCGCDDSCSSGCGSKSGGCGSKSGGCGCGGSDEPSEKDSDSGQSYSFGNGKGCDHCGDDFDVFGLYDNGDEHMDSENSEKEAAKRLADAIQNARKLAGKTPAGMEDELNELLAPKITWLDSVRAKMRRIVEGHGRNDWTRFRTRPLFCGSFIPKKKQYVASFGVLLDTSGSMSQDDMTLGISQLQSLKDISIGHITPADAQIYWDDTVRIEKCDAESLKKTKVTGRGGTCWTNYIQEYSDHIGEVDMLILITDGYLFEDLKSIDPPKCGGENVFWLITSGIKDFKPPFGRVFNLLD